MFYKPNIKTSILNPSTVSLLNHHRTPQFSLKNKTSPHLHNKFSFATFTTTQFNYKQMIDLYSLATPNGQKISIALEEMGLEYKPTTVDIRKKEQFEDWFLKISPNNKIPAIVDHEGPNGKELSLFETGAILLYLAEKTGRFLPQEDQEKKYKTIQWLMWQKAGFGPMLGQMGHFWKYAPEDVTYGKQRYLKESQRLFRVLESQLEGNDYVIGDEYTIADMAIYPWIICVDKFYNMKKEVGEFPNIEKYVERISSREAVQKGMVVCKPES
eukprot:gb/GECH01013551.1/.p1 GENE.gb/GECH01013551.1/~~gb/GECH01013551.1/.p1  ORF type:complete len:270 (+),score=71.53 gb/GECH01013551.1/:1-810(+)